MLSINARRLKTDKSFSRRNWARKQPFEGRAWGWVGRLRLIDGKFPIFCCSALLSFERAFGFMSCRIIDGLWALMRKKKKSEWWRSSEPLGGNFASQFRLNGFVYWVIGDNGWLVTRFVLWWVSFYFLAASVMSDVGNLNFLSLDFSTICGGNVFSFFFDSIKLWAQKTFIKQEATSPITSVIRFRRLSAFNRSVSSAVLRIEALSFNLSRFLFCSWYLLSMLRAYDKVSHEARNETPKEVSQESAEYSGTMQVLLSCFLIPSWVFDVKASIRIV